MITSRVALCLPKDRSTDDARYDSEGRCISPGGRWLIDLLKPRLAADAVDITRLETSQYWSLELRMVEVNLRLTINHIFPFACSAWLLTRRSMVDRLCRRDHSQAAERVFELIGEAMRADPRAGRVLTWRGATDHRQIGRFQREGTTELNGGVRMPGVVRLPPSS